DESSGTAVFPAPVEVTGITSGATAIAAGGDTTCAIVSGAARCWGSNSDGQLGNNDLMNDSNVPVQVQGLTAGASAITVGEAHACAIVSGAAWCWGKNDFGQLGNNSQDDNSPVPVQVTGLTSGVTAIAAGRWHTCAIAAGALKCWGSNLYGEMGLKTDGTGEHAPIQPMGLTASVTAVGLGDETTCAAVSGALKC